MLPDSNTLADLGWTADFLRQLEAHEIGTFHPARVTAVHRDRVTVQTAEGAITVPLPSGVSTGETAVGDWVLVAPERDRVTRLLDRKSRLFRRAAGETSREQLIAANVDAVFITTSCNADFNEARLERYLALAHAGGVPPVFVLTKADISTDPDSYRDRLRAIAPAVPAIALDARDPSAVQALRPWCGRGQTVAFLGSSGVGKSTLIAALTGAQRATGAIREDDAKGRHTTTARSLHALQGGGWLIDTPGMRELRLTDTAEGIDQTFSEIADLAGQCRFADCQHGPEPGCAIQAAIAAGSVDASRLERWQKLRREDEWHSAGQAESRRKDRARGRLHKSAKRAKAAERDF